MPRPRIVHRSARVPDRPQAVTPPSDVRAPSGVRAGEPGSPAGSPRLTALGGGGVMHQVQMENVHPLRLRLLVEIDRTGSISAAAERCGIGQPSASMHLRTLETAIGERLVIRNGRGSRLTGAGKIVASHATRILATLDNMRWALDALNAPSAGALTVAASDAPSLALIPPVLGEFSEGHPGVTVKVRTLPSDLVAREIARGAADIGIAGEAAVTEPVVRKQILVDELIGVAAVDALSVNGRSMSRGEFARVGLLLGPEGSSTKLVAERHLARNECRPIRIWTFDSSAAIKKAVASGLGVSFMSKMVVRDEIERGELVPFRISGVDPMIRPIYVFQSSFAELTPQAAGFKAVLMDVHRSPTPTEPA